ncbi:Putative methyltransferase [Seminavis robusta]|uniref:Methyltransferase n=1 Tax=Seminavis robusta TaxID=568900 RepID=A0A9N8EG47_9STRA|nr:Putative methyltransferase [Seminavis robusta]|eukprot:Sro1074_g238340.1 Putative methyltransferase (303) ;mRNA; r:26742-27650
MALYRLYCMWLLIPLIVSGDEFESPLKSAVNDADVDADDEQCSVGLQEFSLAIDGDLTLQLLQASSAFQGVEHDVTGTVVWGASVCLARFLAKKTGSILRNKISLELGCGCGLPSLVASKKGVSKRVIATDLEPATLEQLDSVAKLNGLQEDLLELFQLDWKDSYDSSDGNNDVGLRMLEDDEKLLQADVILASDVIYHNSMVDPFVQTIDKYLDSTGRAFLALRNTRQGVATLWQKAMPEKGFELVESVSCDAYLAGGSEASDAEATTVPREFQNEANRHRWHGDHTIYVFQWKTSGDRAA